MGQAAPDFTTYPTPRAAELSNIVIARLEAMKRAIEDGPNHEHGALYSRDQLFIDRNRDRIVDAIAAAAEAVLESESSL